MSKAVATTKILLTLSVEQKELLSKLAKAKGLNLSAYLRFKALEGDDSVNYKTSTTTNSSIKHIKKYLKKPKVVPQKYKDFNNFKDFHKRNYKA